MASNAMATTSRILQNQALHLPLINEGCTTGDGKRNIHVQGWTVETCKMPILNSKEIKQCAVQPLSFFLSFTVDYY
jgi:hypothetical protein